MDNTELEDYKQWLLEELDRAVELGFRARIAWATEELEEVNILLRSLDE